MHFFPQQELNLVQRFICAKGQTCAGLRIGLSIIPFLILSIISSTALNFIFSVIWGSVR